MTYYIRFLSTLAAASVICTIAVDPAGEGFVRGYNVVFTFFITTAILWAAALPGAGLLAVRCVKARAIKEPLASSRPFPVFVLLGAATPVLNLLIIRLKAALLPY